MGQGETGVWREAEEESGVGREGEGETGIGRVGVRCMVSVGRGRYEEASVFP